jgi:V8-like Glu-specific endopeptidase
VNLSRARSLLGAPPGGAASATESSGRRIGPPDDTDAQAIARQLRQAAAATNAPVAGRDIVTESDRLAASIVERARAVMAELENGASLGSIDDEGAAALESVIRTRGRPALAVEGNRIEALDADKHPGSGFWRTALDDHEAQLVLVANATGAVTVVDTVTGKGPWVQGTAWLIKPDLVVTNRHVVFPPAAEGVRLAKRVAERPTEALIKGDYKVSIDFAFDDGPARTINCAVTGVPYVSAEGDAVDIAMLRITPVAGVSALSVATASSATKQLYVFGHPGRLTNVPDDVAAVFGTPNGRKRVSFGERMDADPARPGEIAHDASTIGGFSGGCVLAFGSPDVTALHYYGDPVQGNRAITAATLRAHAVAAYL